MKLKFFLCVLALLLLLPVPGTGQGNPAFNGKWTFIQQMSEGLTDLQLLEGRTLAVEAKVMGA